MSNLAPATGTLELTMFAPVLTTHLPAGGLLFADPSPLVTGRFFRAVVP